MAPFENIRAWLRPVPGLPMAEQVAMAARIGAGAVYDAATPRERDLYTASLRPGDTAYLPRLDCIMLPAEHRGRTRPTADFAGALAALLATGATVVDGVSGVTSRDGKRWANQVSLASQRLASAPRSRKHMQAIGRKGGETTRAASAAAKWGGEALARQREIWCSAVYPNAKAARAALHPDLRGYGPTTLYSLLGPRRPGDPSAGGRGKRRKGRKST